LEEAWKLYQATMTDVDLLAMARHLLRADEFRDIAVNQHIRKYLARDDAGNLVGMSTLTNDLASWPLISPRYLERKYPDHYRRGAIWYCGFVCAMANDAHAYPDMVLTMWDRIRSNDGIAFMDYCSYNVDFRRIPQRTRALMARAGKPVRHVPEDAQSFWIMEAA
jgi:hypothetical protein